VSTIARNLGSDGRRSSCAQAKLTAHSDSGYRTSLAAPHVPLHQRELMAFSSPLTIPITLALATRQAPFDYIQLTVVSPNRSRPDRGDGNRRLNRLRYCLCITRHLSHPGADRQAEYRNRTTTAFCHGLADRSWPDCVPVPPHLQRERETVRLHPSPAIVCFCTSPLG